MHNQKHILIVDDNQDTVGLLGDFLMDNGFSVSSAFTAQEGFQRIIEKRPDLIVLDLYLPDIMGSDVCAQLRNNAATRDIPVILCTSHQVSFGEKMKGFRAGVDDYLIRPFELAELLARIDAVLRRTQLKPKAELLADIQTMLTESKPRSSSWPSAPAAPKSGSRPVSAPFNPSPIEPAQPAPKKEPQPIQIMAQLWRILNHPFRVFQTSKHNEDFFIGILLVLGTPAAASITKLSNQSGSFDAWIGFFSLGIVTNLVTWFATAGLLHMTLPFHGVTLSMRRSLAVAGMSWAPRLTGALFSAVYCLFAIAGLAIDPDHFTSGANLFFNIGFSRWIDLLGPIGLFDFWSAWIVLAAVWTITGTKEKKWTPITLLIGLSCLAFGALTRY